MASAGFTCEVPREWEEIPGGGTLLDFAALDDVREVGVSLSLLTAPPYTREELAGIVEKLKNTPREDPQYSITPPSEVQIAGTRGYSWTSTMTRFAEHMHRTTPLPAPVKLRES